MLNHGLCLSASSFNVVQFKGLVYFMGENLT